jgi:hypothetical protein
MGQIIVKHDAGTYAAIRSDFHSRHQNGVDTRSREIADVTGISADMWNFAPPQNFMHCLAVIKPQSPTNSRRSDVNGFTEDAKDFAVVVEGKRC